MRVLALMLISTASFVSAQTKTTLDPTILRLDFGQVFTQTDNALVYGFIGSDFQRIRVKLISVIKNAEKPEEYMIYGKSMVKGNICDFQGTLKITKAAFNLEQDTEENKQGRITGTYVFYENPSQKHVGIFRGSFASEFYVDREGKVHYDDLMIEADGFSNNRFTGSWTSYDGKLSKKCNWGDYRIPDCDDLDVGAGEFIPNDKYAAKGWRVLITAIGQGTQAEEARRQEKEVWWR